MQTPTVETRSFPEIWATLSKNEKEEVTYQIIKDRCAMARQTVWNWATGKTQPTSPIVRNAVANAVGRALGSKPNGNTLFPAR